MSCGFVNVEGRLIGVRLVEMESVWFRRFQDVKCVTTRFVARPDAVNFDGLEKGIGRFFFDGDSDD